MTDADIYFFLFLHINLCHRYSLEVPQQGASSEYSCLFLWRNHYENTSVQIGTKIPPPKTKNVQIKKSVFFFSYFCSKHRLWIPIRTASRGSSNEYPQSIFLQRNKSRNNKNNVYPFKPQFYYKEVGFKKSELYRYVFEMRKKYTCLLYSWQIRQFFN